MLKSPIFNFEFKFTKKDCENFFSATQWQLHKAPLVPPTIATICRTGEFEAIRQMNISLDKVLHAEQEYRFVKPLAADTSYKCSTYLKSKMEKNGSLGKMSFLVFCTTLNNENNEICLESFTTIVVREPK